MFTYGLLPTKRLKSIGDIGRTGNRDCVDFLVDLRDNRAE